MVFFLINFCHKYGAVFAIYFLWLYLPKTRVTVYMVGVLGLLDGLVNQKTTALMLPHSEIFAFVSQ